MTPEDVAAYVDAAARALQLPLHAEHRPGVLDYFAMAAAMAESLETFPLGVDDEPAVTFAPVPPGKAEP